MKKLNLYLLILIFIFLSILLFFKLNESPLKENNFNVSESDNSFDFKKFSSEGEFKKYLNLTSRGEFAASDFGLSRNRGVQFMKTESFSMQNSRELDVSMGLDASVDMNTSIDRLSKTNVQVENIDEPDIVKADKNNIFLSRDNYYKVLPFKEERMGIFSDAYVKRDLSIIDAFPPKDIEKIGSIDDRGDLLLNKNTLAVFSYEKITAYDVSNRRSPKKKWTINFQDGVSVKRVRLYDSKIYLLTQKRAGYKSSCPIGILKINNKNISIPCEDIYYPKKGFSLDNLYSLSVFDFETGELKDKVSFLASFNAELYMSENALYVAYSHKGDMVEFFSEFIFENNDIFPEYFLEKLKKLMMYDLSSQARQTEFNIMLSGFQASLGEDERLKVENDVKNRLEAYVLKNKRNIQSTNIVKIKIDDFSKIYTGSVPGSLLNNYSMDEYKTNLRIATNISGNFFGIYMFNAQSQSVNDVYVLDNELNLVGSVLDLGKDEKIYSVRFLRDKAYVVTFRQIDPFYVLDLSDAENPSVEGELKIPGFSSYLHPINKDKILGIGKEDSNVKISLFDVSDAKNPKELSKYILNEYWSESLNNPHAFLLDDKFGVFFIPGSKGGYVLSYKDDKLSLEKAIGGIRAKRALFINDYLYIIGSDKIVVLNEKTWEREAELNF